MKIVVCIKQVGSLGDDIEFTSDCSDVDQQVLEMALNEWDSAAVEEALQIKEKLVASAEVVAVTVGAHGVEPALYQYLAMGVDRAIRVDGVERQDPIAIAGALADVIRQEQPDLILCGVQSSDWAQAATGSALAGFLDVPVVALARKLDLDCAAKRAVVTRELDGGRLDVVQTSIPAVITVQTGINSPRYATLRAIKQAQRRPPEVATANELPSFGGCIRQMFVPQRRGGAQMLGADAAEVAAKVHALIAGALK
jgi:electron transfer flavoprotein beta subunit